MITQDYEYSVVGCAFDIAPILTHVALVSCSDTDVLSIPECLPYTGEWGNNETVSFLEESNHLLPKGIHVIFLSIVERKFYIVNDSLPIEEIYNLWNHGSFNKVVVGMAPYGGIAIWLNGTKNSVLVKWLHGSEINVDMKSFIPDNPDVNLEQLSSFYLNSVVEAKSYFEEHGIPPRNLFEGYMQQFIYRYLILFEHWDEDKRSWQKYNEEEIKPQFYYTEEALFDGTHDKLHEDRLMNYHEAGKPKKLAVLWYVGKSEFTAYFWFEDEEIRAVFDRFYGAHPETKTDFMIRIDAEQNKYELALYRYGLKEPQVISESAYQLLVFKNKFEYYRSENYNQPKGAWIW